MPETRKYETNEMVDIDNSGPEVDVTLPEEKKEEVKDEQVVESNEPIIEEVKADEPEPEQKTEEPVKEEKEVKVQEDKSSEDKKELEEYSDGVKKRIAKLTKKMREAERQKEAALEYAKGVKAEADKTKSKLSTMEPGYMNAMEGRVKSGLQAAEAKLSAAREAGDIKAEVEAQRQRQAREQDLFERERELQIAREQEAARRAELDRQQALAMQQAAVDALAVDIYVAIINNTVASNWDIPPSARNGMTAVLGIRLVPTGEVISVDVIQGSGNAAFDRSVEQAVRRAERFPELQDISTTLFETTFRNLTITFRPEDLLR